MDDGGQLDLFGWDRVKVGEGFSALGRLDLPRALVIFEEPLARWPGHPGASAGLAMAAAWDDALRETERLQKREAAATLWERIKSYCGPHELYPLASCRFPFPRMASNPGL